jgi:predicted nucleic acid-binding protein
VSLVIDASMAIAWLFRSERTQAAQSILRRVVTEGATVPSLWRLEIANVLRASARRGRCDDEYVDWALHRLGRLAIRSDAETDSHAWSTSLDLARQHDLTLYDAAYLELAVRLGGPIATCNNALVRAGERCGVEVLSA